jgi:Mrp family chromosome partitioning ATPase
MMSTHIPFEKSERDGGFVLLSEAATAQTLTQPDDLLWPKLPTMKLNHGWLEQNRIITANRVNDANVTFDILRTKILKIMRQNNWTSLIVTSPTPACGKTVVSINLALSLANLRDCRTVLIDLDLRHPQVGNLLNIDKNRSVARLLTGKSTVEQTFVRCGENIAVGANWHPVPYASELLQSPDTSSIMADLKDRLKPDIIVFDMPPMLVNDDVLSFLPYVDCAVLVVAAEESTLGEIDICERNLSSESNLLGVVLNKCHYGPERYGY